jgi:type I restriction enzyme S subunit
MSEWVRKAIGDVCDIKHGYAFSGEHITTELSPYILITPGNFRVGGGFKIANNQKHYDASDFPESYILNVGDIIVTMTDLSQDGDTLGYSAIVPKTNLPCLHNQRIGLIERIRNIDRSFLYWVMRSDEYQATIVNSATGSTVKHTSPTRIGEYVFLAPIDEKEQEAIAEVLSSLDDKIDLLTRQNATLEALAQTYFRQWFIENDSEKWGECAIADKYNVLLGGTPSTSNSDYWKNGTVGWINSGKVNEFRILTASEMITEEGLRHSAAKMLPTGTTVVAITGATLEPTEQPKNPLKTKDLNPQTSN